MAGAVHSDARGPASDGALWLALFDSHPDPLMYLDGDHRVVRVNEAQARALGCRAEEVAGRFCYEVMHGSSGPAEGCPHARMLRENREQSAELMVERLLGGYFLVTVKPLSRADGRLAGVLHVARDITASKILESELRGACDSLGARVESRAMDLRNRLLFDRLLAMMARRLGPNMIGLELRETIQQELARIVEALGFGRCVFWEAQGDALRAVAQYGSAAAALPSLAATATRESVPFLFEVAAHDGFLRRAEGGVARCAAGLCAPGAALPAFLLLVECPEHSPGCDFLYEDVLRLMCEMLGGLMRRAAEAADLQRLRQKLLEADRVARSGQLAAALAHELNQPLAATLCNAQAAVHLLAREPPDMKEARAAIDDIVDAARRAGTVMRRTRALFMGGPAHREAVDLNLTVCRVREMMRGDTALTGVTLRTELHQALPPVLGDETQLQQVMRNLLANACDAVGGKPHGERVISIRTGMGDGGSVELCVQDSGVGFVEGMEERIFEPFYTTKPAGQGMGLSICRQIALSHGGAIRAERRPEGGALFRMTLPAFSDE